MSEQIKTTTVDQLPEADNLDGLYVFGFASKNAVGKRSVKAPITLLKGNKGDTGAAGKDGKDGEVTAVQLEEALRGIGFLASEEANGLMSASDKKQLNEIIESMKANIDKYNTHIQMVCNNDYTGAMDGNFYIKNINYKDVIRITSRFGETKIAPQEKLGGYLTAPISFTDKNDIIDIYMNNLIHISASTITKSIDSLVFANTSEHKISQITWANCPANRICLRGLINIQEVVLTSTKAPFLDLSNTLNLKNVNVARSVNLVELLIGRSTLIDEITLTDLDVGYCTALKKVLIGKVAPYLTYVNIRSSGFDIAGLGELVEKWGDRTGKDTGVLVIDRALYDTMSSELRQKFTSKNITFDIV